MAADPRLIDFAREMRHEPTPAELAVWRLLRNHRLAGFKFRRQHPVGRYIADFYAPSSALVLELDGDTHATEEGIEHDRVRQAYLESLGLLVVRVWNFEVRENPTGFSNVFGSCAPSGRANADGTRPRVIDDSATGMVEGDCPLTRDSQSLVATSPPEIGGEVGLSAATPTPTLPHRY
jgi:very-short-patch-repair endonuclease